MRTLSDLARLRRFGKAPALPVFVTTSERFARNLRDVGAAVISIHESAVDWDWRPVAGLDVILVMVGPTIARVILEARPRRLQALTAHGLSVTL